MGVGGVRTYSRVKWGVYSVNPPKGFEIQTHNVTYCTCMCKTAKYTLYTVQSTVHDKNNKIMMHNLERELLLWISHNYYLTKVILLALFYSVIQLNIAFSFRRKYIITDEYKQITNRYMHWMNKMIDL